MSARRAAWHEIQVGNGANESNQPSAHGRKHALMPPRLGVAGNAPSDACFDCGKIGVKSGHPGCASPNVQNEKGKAALAAYKKRVDGFPRARSPHVMAAVAPSKETPRMSYARAASTTADPDHERAISFSMATISRHQNSALEEEDSDSDDETQIPALAPLSELNDLDDNPEVQALCPRHPPIKPLPFHRRSKVEFVSGLVVNGKLSSALWDTAACNRNLITAS